MFRSMFLAAAASLTLLVSVNTSDAQYWNRRAYYGNSYNNNGYYGNQYYGNSNYGNGYYGNGYSPAYRYNNYQPYAYSAYPSYSYAPAYYPSTSYYPGTSLYYSTPNYGFYLNR